LALVAQKKENEGTQTAVVDVGGEEKDRNQR